MKIVHNNRQVCHLFANASQPEARGSNFRFETESIRIGKKDKDFLVLYSYRTPIAFQLVVKDPERFPATICITSDNYSPSTGRHLSYLRSAANHQQTITVDSCRRGSYAYEFIQMTLDAKTMRTRLEQEFKVRAQNIPEFYNARQMPKTCYEFLCRVNSAKQSFETIHGRKLAYNFPAKLLALATEYEAKQAARNNAREEQRAKEQEAHNAQYVIELAEKLPAWRSGAQIHLPPHYAAYLRLKSDGEAVQTSHGAEVPLKLALAFYHRLLAGEARPGQHVGSFTLNDCSGDPIRIGCHVIMRQEMADLYATISRGNGDFIHTQTGDVLDVNS